MSRTPIQKMDFNIFRGNSIRVLFFIFLITISSNMVLNYTLLSSPVGIKKNFPNTPLQDIIPITTSENLEIQDGNFTGSGQLLEAQKFAQIQGNSLNFQTNSSLEINLRDWNATQFNIDVNDLFLKFTTTGELDLLKDEKLNPDFPIAAQPFQILFDNCSLESICVYLKIRRFNTGLNDLIVEIWNASNPISPSPNHTIYSEEFEIGEGDPIDFFDVFQLNFSSPITLYQNQTENATFFIVLKEISGGGIDAEWVGADDMGGGTSDNDDEFIAWLYDGVSWNLVNRDYSLNTTIKYVPQPSEINLKINNISVSDMNYGSGTWLYSPPFSNNGTHVFNVTSNYSASLNLNWVFNITQLNYFETTFLVKSGWNYSEWNVSQTVTFFENSYNRLLNITLPTWNIEKVRCNNSEFYNWSFITNSRNLSLSIIDPSNGTWIIECNSSNYVHQISTQILGTTVSSVNTSDIIDIFASFRENLTSGYTNLTIFPTGATTFKDSIESLQNNKSVQFKSWDIFNTTLFNPGEFNIQVTWYNGTAVGMNMTSLNVLSIPTNLTYISHTSYVEGGESIFVLVNFVNNYTQEPLLAASLIVKNSSSTNPWPTPYQISHNYLNGTFEIEITTVGLSVGLHQFSVNMSKPLYLSSELAPLNVTITGGISNLSVNAPNCFGLIAINQSHALVDPFPYHNSTVKIAIFYFSNDSSNPLRNAIITASWIGGGPQVSWNPAFFGYYNITIDVTGFHSDTNHTLKISIQELGYESAELFIIVPIRKLPTAIEPFEPSYSHYLEESFIVYVVFRDTYRDQSIPYVYELGGNCTIRLGTYSENMTLLVAGLGIYQFTITPKNFGLEEGKTYNLTIFAFSSEHEFAVKNVSLYIIPKQLVNLFLIGVPNFLLAGENYKIFAQLMTINNTPIYNIPLTCKFIYPSLGTIQTVSVTNNSGIAEINFEAKAIEYSLQINVEYSGNITIQNKSVVSTVIPIIRLNSSLIITPLPEEILQGEILEITATLTINGSLASDELITIIIQDIDGNTLDIKSTVTDETGKATITWKVDVEVNQIVVLASYSGLDYINPTDISAQVKIISIFDLIWRYAYIWLTSIGIIIALVFGYYINKRLLRLSKFQKNIRNFKEELFKGTIKLKVTEPSRDELLQQLLDDKFSKFGFKKVSKNA